MINVQRDDPFFASILLGLKRIPKAISTMCVDGKTLSYSRKYVGSIEDNTLYVVLIHEALHLAMAHHLVIKGKTVNMDLANRAADLAINHLIYKRKGFLSCFLLAGKGSYKDLPEGKNMEWYYNTLIKKQEPNESSSTRGDSTKSGDSGDAGGSDNAEDSDDADSDPEEGDSDNQTDSDGTASGGDDEAGGDASSINPGGIEPAQGSTEDAEREYEYTIGKAVAAAKEAGKFPGWLAELCEHILGVSQIPYNVLLRQFLVRTVRTGHTYRKINRRHAYRSDVIIPARYSKGLGHVVMGVDTSGSMDEIALNQCLTEVSVLGKLYRDFQLTLIQFDTKVHRIDKFSSSKPIPSKGFTGWAWHGRGGTSYSDFFIVAEKERPDVVIIYTDGYADFPGTNPMTCPALWLVTTEVDPPWGEVARVFN